MLPGVNPRQMKQMMKRMGVSQNDLDAVQVIIKTSDKMLIFENPQVSKVNMMGQESYQVTGEPIEQPLDTKPSINEEDIKTVMEQASVDYETAKKSIENSNGDLAEAILSLQND
ncbi:MAG: nascent polypeptide-associated complex protein [Candidatus Woesearchaeota archaeon]